MSVAVVTGAAGLIGSEAVSLFSAKGFDVVGIDNDMRRQFFGDEASTVGVVDELRGLYPNYRHYDEDIRTASSIDTIFSTYGRDIEVVIHAASQPSHDWAATSPETDFTVNANGTLTLLEAARRHAPEAAFIFVSTNKVYGDTPNRLPLIELESRWEIDPDHPFADQGIDETMSIDHSLHSLFGASKVAADILVQEYGRYFGMKTGVFRAGCLTGPRHRGVKLQGFLAYLMRCAVHRTPYTVLGYKGKQVRDNLHCNDALKAFWHFMENPRPGEVYNLGGGRYSNCSVNEAVQLCEETTGNKMNTSYDDTNRPGDHIWWISDTGKFRSHYPGWKPEIDLRQILHELSESFST